MFTLLKNEFIKMFKRTKTRSLLVLFFLAVAGCLFIAEREAANWERWNDVDIQIKNEEYNLKQEKEYLEEVETRLKTLKDKNEIKNETESLQIVKQNIQNAEERLIGLKKEKENPISWQTKLKEEIKRNNEEIKNSKRQLEELNVSTGMKQAEKELQKKRIERDIAFMEEYNVKAEYALSIDVQPLSGSEFEAGNLIMNFSVILSLAIPLFIAIFGSDIVSDEATNETFKFLLIQPVKRGKILWAKFLTLVSTMLTLIIGTQIVIFLVVGFTKGFEHLKLIYKVGAKYEYNALELKNGFEIVEEVVNTGYYITLGEYVGQIFLFQALFIIAGCALVFMISTICKSNMISMAVATVVLVGGSILPMFISTLGKYAHLTFLGYNNSVFLLNGEIAYMYNNIGYSNELGIILMIASTIVFLIIAQINFNKKDILV